MRGSREADNAQDGMMGPPAATIWRHRGDPTSNWYGEWSRPNGDWLYAFGEQRPAYVNGEW